MNSLRGKSRRPAFSCSILLETDFLPRRLERSDAQHCTSPHHMRHDIWHCASIGNESHAWPCTLELSQGVGVLHRIPHPSQNLRHVFVVVLYNQTPTTHPFVPPQDQGRGYVCRVSSCIYLPAPIGVYESQTAGHDQGVRPSDAAAPCT